MKRIEFTCGGKIAPTLDGLYVAYVGAKAQADRIFPIVLLWGNGVWSNGIGGGVVRVDVHGWIGPLLPWGEEAAMADADDMRDAGLKLEYDL